MIFKNEVHSFILNTLRKLDLTNQLKAINIPNISP
jgi:hypothetical protein